MERETMKTRTELPEFIKLPKTDEQDAFIIALTREFPDLGNGQIMAIARWLRRAARSFDTLALYQCNVGELTPRQQATDERLEAQLLELGAALGCEFQTGGDPRGYCLKIKLQKTHGNTWGGEGWFGVPVAKR